MRIQDHLGKITWTMLDKGLFVGYGLIRLLQVSKMEPSEFGLFALLDALVLAIATLSDSFSLQSIVKFGSNHTIRQKINSLALISHVGLSMLVALIIYFLRFPLSQSFNEPGLIHVGAMLPLLCFVTLPRIMAVKYLLRETNMRSVFFVNAAWFFSMGLLTIFFLQKQEQLLLQDMIVIAGTGSLAGSVLGISLALPHMKFTIPDLSSVKVFYRFGLYQVAWTMPATIMRQLDLYFVQFFFGATVVGIFQSAKTLFRFFESIINGISGLYYPALVRIHARNDKAAERAITSKIISFSMFAMICIVIALHLGIGEWMITTFLSEKYAHAYKHFALLMNSAIILPMTITAIVYIVHDAMNKLLFNAIVSCIVGIIISIFIGLSGHEQLVAFGTIAYTVTFSILGIRYAMSEGLFKPSDFFRAIPDTIAFVKHSLFSKA